MNILYNIISIIGGFILLGCFIWVARNATKKTDLPLFGQVDEIVKESQRRKR